MALTPPEDPSDSVWRQVASHSVPGQTVSRGKLRGLVRDDEIYWMEDKIHGKGYKRLHLRDGTILYAESRWCDTLVPTTCPNEKPVEETEEPVSDIETQPFDMRRRAPRSLSTAYQEFQRLQKELPDTIGFIDDQEPALYRPQYMQGPGSKIYGRHPEQRRESDDAVTGGTEPSASEASSSHSDSRTTPESNHFAGSVRGSRRGERRCHHSSDGSSSISSFLAELPTKHVFWIKLL